MLSYDISYHLFFVQKTQWVHAQRSIQLSSIAKTFLLVSSEATQSEPKSKPFVVIIVIIIFAALYFPANKANSEYVKNVINAGRC